MTCFNHPDRASISFCRACGRPLCPACQRLAEGTVYCPEHQPVASQQDAGAGSQNYAAGPNPYAQGQTSGFAAPPLPPIRTSPGLAFVLGWIPGVGAIYNGQYLKGLVHAGIFGLIVSLLSSSEDRPIAPFLGILLATFIFYMPFEAFHTAKKRQLGIPVEEWSSLGRGSFPMAGAGRTPVGPIVLIAIGVLFLLDTMNLIEFRDIGRFWPVILIAVGASMLYSRMTGPHHTPVPPYTAPAGGPFPGAGPLPSSTPMNPTSPYTTTPTGGSDFGERGHE